MSFGHPAWFWAFLAIPALAFLFVYAERRSAARLHNFVSPRLLPQLGATVNRSRRVLRFALLLLGIALAIVALAQPRWGYSYEEVKRQGLDLIMAVDTSRSMLANDVPPNRLQRVKLSGQDLIAELRGDRVGLIAFAGRAFLQAPLTIDYDAAVEALNDLDTNVIPEGGTNISAAIDLAVRTFGKSAVGNRALIIFTDGEELAGDAASVAKTAAEAGVKIFTVGVGTSEGSLIPVPSRSGGTAFVKDASGQVVKSKLDEKRLREIAETTGGFFVPLGSGPDAMRRLYNEGLSKMQAAQIDARMSQQPIERYQWPLGAAMLAIAASMLISERQTARKRVVRNGTATRTASLAGTAVALLLFANSANAAAPGLDAYRSERFPEAYEQLQQTLQAHPDTRATDKIQFDAGAAAYKMKDYSKALQSFSQALLSPDKQLQARSHYNLGNTLYQRGEAEKTSATKLTEWTNALQHYGETLKLEPQNKEAQENAEFVKKKIEDLKRQQEQKPTPTPSPSPSPKQDKKDQKQDQKDKNQQQQSGDNKDQQKKNDEGQQSKDDQGGNKDQPQPGQSPSPSASPSPDQKQDGSASPSPSPQPSAGSSASQSPTPGGQSSQPSPSPGDDPKSPSPSPGEGEPSATPSPSPGESDANGDGTGDSPTPAPSGTPGKKPSGDVKAAPQDQPPQKSDGEPAEAEPVEEGQMTEQQAERLLKSMKDEEQRVQLDEHRATRRVYKDW